MPSSAVTSRAAGPDDTSFLFEVFAESGDAEIFLAGADPQLLRLQFGAQQIGYASQFPRAVHEIVLIDGAPAGQVRWAELDDEVRIIDISVLARYRRRGAAAAVYRTILEHARSRGKPARASVTRLNTVSLAFHERLGFVVEGDSDTHLFLTTGSTLTC